MERLKKYSKVFPVLLMCLFFVLNSIEGQSIERLNIPTSICAGSSVTVTFGYDSTHNIVVATPQYSLGHSERIFLPDGISCGDMGCSYQSPVNFTAFGSGDTLSSVQDIEYIRVNIEHSYIADLYINITCPNGRKADIMRFGGFANSECSSNIALSSQGWLSGNNVSDGTYFGLANDNESVVNGCDPTLVYNEPGIGWNYCWSQNTTSGYQYASGDGIVYRSGHAHNDIIDSSNVAAGTNFYHPDQSFSSLIGCPLNGEWYIEVLDGFSSDNGYLFGWELSLNSSLIGDTGCVFDSFAIVGYGISRVDDSSFTIVVPADLSADTTILYHFQAFDNCGHVVDTAVYIAVHPNWNQTVRQEVVENSLPVTFCNESFNNDVNDRTFQLESTFGCDSVIHYYLTVWRNVSFTYDTLICETTLPIEWRGVHFNTADTAVIRLHTVHEADSTIWLVLHAKRQDTIQIRRSICEGVSYTWIDGVAYSDPSQHPVVVLPSVGVCDSVLRLTLYLPENPFQAEMSIVPNPVQIDNPVCTAIDISGSRRRVWYFIDRSDTTRQITFNYPMNSDSIDVVLVAYDQNGCRDSVSRIVYLDKTVFWAPNVFTPNEQTNKFFKIPSEDVLSGEVQIFDRAGRHIITFDLHEGSWDGTLNGKPCPQGTYVWHIKYIPRSQPNIEKESIGTVTLLR